jgi:hypothetical protein
MIRDLIKGIPSNKDDDSLFLIFILSMFKSKLRSELGREYYLCNLKSGRKLGFTVKLDSVERGGNSGGFLHGSNKNLSSELLKKELGLYCFPAINMSPTQFSGLLSHFAVATRFAASSWASHLVGKKSPLRAQSELSTLMIRVRKESVT